MEQDIVARGGAAYGAVYGDVHISGQQGIRYVLHRAENPLHTVPEMDAGSFSALVTWLHEEPEFSVRWLTGGRHRVEVCDALVALCPTLDWLAMAATPAPELPPGKPIQCLDERRGLLVIIDDAHTWSLSDLTWLLSDGALRCPGRPTRVLCVALDRQLWPAVRASLAHIQASTSSQAVPER